MRQCEANNPGCDEEALDHDAVILADDQPFFGLLPSSPESSMP
jgi:hypothetical protein